MGIFPLLDEECQFPKSTDKSFLEKLIKNHESNAIFIKARTAELQFAVTHYAGKVLYQLDGFLEKNRDLLRQDLEIICHTGEFHFLSKIVASGKQDDTMRRATLRQSTPSKAAITNVSKSKTVGSKFEVSWRNKSEPI
jgi:myosin heavy subunit